jgi:hypothetical protein
MSAVASSSAILPISGFPEAVDVHWETQRRVVWNEQEHMREEHELVYVKSAVLKSLVSGALSYGRTIR